MRKTKKELFESAAVVGLYIACKNNGDASCRMPTLYRFFDKPAHPGGKYADYHAGVELGTCLGLREAHVWLSGYRALYAKLLNEGVIKLSSVQKELVAGKV